MLTTSQWLALVLFLGTLAAIYLHAAKIVLAWVYARVRGKSAPPVSRWTKGEHITTLALAVAGLFCLADAYFVEPYWPEVTHVTIVSPKIPKGHRPIRIVQISDLHSDPKVRLEDQLPDIIAPLSPDAIVFTGDAANSPQGLPNFKRCMKRLAQIAPTFSVRGNWDWPDDLVGGTGVKELDGEAGALDVGGAKLWIAGAAVSNPDSIRRALAKAPARAFTVLLYHYPDMIDEIARTEKVDLYLAGHTHGGQVALPFYGAIVTFSALGKKYESGRYRVGDTWMYVNRGIGMEGHIAPRLRFCARPEVTLIEIKPQ